MKSRSLLKQNTSMKAAAPTTRCRVCGGGFFQDPLLRYEDMPGAAQFLPDTESLESDSGVDLDVYQCSGCGLVQLSNAPVPYYRDVIRAAAFSTEMKDFRMKQFESFIRRFSLSGKKVVEIGCGCGEFLSMLQQLGVAAYGLEHSHESAARCQKDGLRVSRGFIESRNYGLDHAPFDAFLLLNFLEHLPDPNSALTGIRNNLSDGAVGLVEVPNFDMILRNRLFCEFIGDHLFYFTEETLNATLRLNGFEVIDCEEIWHEYILSAVVRKRKRLDLSRFHEHRQQLKSQMEGYIHRFGNKRVAIWGAGHQALAAISLMKLGDKVKYVVDSATFKQGKYTPATHVPIVSPDALESDPVDAIIVMGASYSDEVAKNLQRKSGGNMSISVFRDFGLELIHHA
jgi:2-polyprenyl-3-methyl-5-hydroxy-6-metoxy-1,4-benzoquinol methylase